MNKHPTPHEIRYERKMHNIWHEYYHGKRHRYFSGTEYTEYQEILKCAADSLNNIKREAIWQLQDTKYATDTHGKNRIAKHSRNITRSSKNLSYWMEKRKEAAKYLTKI